MPADPQFGLSTPSLLFPAISLLMLAYTNRFLALSTIIRQLYDMHRSDPHEKLLRQLGNLKQRVALIRGMQAAGVLSLLCCIVSMILVFANQPANGYLVFGASLLLMVISLLLCLAEVMISDAALNILLKDIADDLNRDNDGKGYTSHRN
ncbi:Protein of unknown function [Andreprevotia lacus DSM 23236]|jgi:hypothetical protein|uniref:II family cellulose-binding protein n=1 Tax=Andreprevotia lacus DSM 23236 TaxID=1121001 RepID=A0A1W1XAV3_9NEIS|nr:DUF2721 domain-containing protein [Andreprevotia lacus]SMC20987.1 Protein of unknown function [Andreprevotia lacus DSM 23236]